MNDEYLKELIHKIDEDQREHKREMKAIEERTERMQRQMLEDIRADVKASEERHNATAERIEKRFDNLESRFERLETNVEYSFKENRYFNTANIIALIALVIGSFIGLFQIFQATLSLVSE